MSLSIPSTWRELPERYRLMGSICKTCNTEYFPQRAVCLKCRRKGVLVDKKMPEQGRIFSFTEVHAAPAGFEFESPYVLALIDLDNGVRILSQVVDSEIETVKVGCKVSFAFRKIAEDGKEGIIAYGYKFKVVR